MFQQEIQSYSPYTPTKLLFEENDEDFSENNLSPINPVKILNFDTQQTTQVSSPSSIILELQQKITSEKEQIKKIENTMKYLDCISEEYLDLFNKKQKINKKIKEYERDIERQIEIQVQMRQSYKREDDQLMFLKFSVYVNHKVHLNYSEIKQLPEQYDASTNKKPIISPIKKYTSKYSPKTLKSPFQSPIRSTSVILSSSNKKNNPQLIKSQSKSLKKSSLSLSKPLNVQRKLSFFSRYVKRIDQLEYKNNRIRESLGYSVPLNMYNKPVKYCFI